jgi:thioesterase domain-containing protein
VICNRPLQRQFHSITFFLASLAHRRLRLEHAGMTFEEPERRIERYLYQYIPLSAAMGVQVRTATIGHVKLAAPLRPNVNHTETVFGGSAAALATLSAWTLLHLRLEYAGLDARLVIQRSSMEYERPIAGDFEAECRFADETAWRRFCSMLERRGRARLTLAAQLLHAAHEMGSFVGDFVALAQPGGRP